MVDSVNDDELMPNSGGEPMADQLKNNAWLIGLVILGSLVGIVGMDLALVGVIAISIALMSAIVGRELIDF
jgi:hypothetical protein